FFDFDSARLTDQARNIIRQAADAARRDGYARIDLTGHADRSGSDRYNLRLSQRRADAVKAELQRLGIRPNEIQTAARGESQPLVQTADGVREPHNRRVEIVIVDRR
ncbi:MAG: OmpA family protein, partial [Alphaproteobacteria bacterium]|nr:OmpA family protein [Alphaproteobacteria bacterium]